jgi:phosphoribosylglycinamide formyltransferase-1
MHSLVIFASGAGSNAAAIIEYFKKNGKAKVGLIVCNKPDAGVLGIAQREKIPAMLVTRETFKGDQFVEELKAIDPSLIILAGFMWKIPEHVVEAFPDRIINIHPALLPLYGGKGMYGHHVHTAVLAAKEKESGITIHYVNEHYDEGNIIVQARLKVHGDEQPDDLATRIHKLEHFYFPRTIEFLLNEQEKK